MISLKGEKETVDFGEKISSLLKDGVTLALVGDLGSGKTTLSKAIIHSLTGIEDIPSPTFNIGNEYNANAKTIYHFDFYRLEEESELYGIGFDDYLSNKKAIIIIEWADKFESSLPKNYLKFKFTKYDDARDVEIISVGKKYMSIADEIENLLK